jgi:hypothetical protein
MPLTAHYAYLGIEIQAQEFVWTLVPVFMILPEKDDSE